MPRWLSSAKMEVVKSLLSVSMHHFHPRINGNALTFALFVFTGRPGHAVRCYMFLKRFRYKFVTVSLLTKRFHVLCLQFARIHGRWRRLKHQGLPRNGHQQLLEASSRGSLQRPHRLQQPSQHKPHCGCSRPFWRRIVRIRNLQHGSAAQWIRFGKRPIA